MQKPIESLSVMALFTTNGMLKTTYLQPNLQLMQKPVGT
jgi:hypothetical protein